MIIQYCTCMVWLSPRIVSYDYPVLYLYGMIVTQYCKLPSPSIVVVWVYIITLQVYNDNSSYSSDSFSKYVSNPANKHDDSKLRDKFGTTQLPKSPLDKNAKNDPYRYTRSTAKPYKTATIDKSKMSDLSTKYRLVTIL